MWLGKISSANKCLKFRSVIKSCKDIVNLHNFYKDFLVFGLSIGINHQQQFNLLAYVRYYIHLKFADFLSICYLTCSYNLMVAIFV